MEAEQTDDFIPTSRDLYVMQLQGQIMLLEQRLEYLEDVIRARLPID